jgi:hypothetical protein
VKRIKTVQVTGLFLFIIYIILIAFDFTIGFIDLKSDILFSIVLAIISLNLIYKGVLLKSSSTLWFALNLILYAILIVLLNLISVDYRDYYVYFVLIPIIPSVITLAVFNNLMYIKVIILNISIFIPLIVYSTITQNIWWVISIGCMGLFLGILICRMLKFSKEKV